MPPIPNVGTDWFLISVPLRLGQDAPIAAVLLSSEQDGVSAYVEELPGFEGARRAGVKVLNAHFREDEIIDDDAASLSRSMMSVTLALRCALAAGFGDSVTARIDKSSLRTAIEEQLNAAVADLDSVLANRKSMASATRAECTALLERFDWVIRASVAADRTQGDIPQMHRLINRGLSVI